MKKILNILLIALAFNAQAQNQDFEKGFVQVHKEKQSVHPLLFENKGVAKPISIVPWRQKEIATIKKGTLAKVLAYEANEKVYYIYFVFIQNKIKGNSIEVYEAAYNDSKPYKILSYITDSDDAESWSKYSDNEAFIRDAYLYFGSGYTDSEDAEYYYKYRYKLGKKLKVEDEGYLQDLIKNTYTLANHSRTDFAGVVNGELTIIPADDEEGESEFVTQYFKHGFYIGSLSWSLNDKYLYFDNYNSGLACIWRYNTENKELSKIVPEHEAKHPFSFTYKHKEYVFYIEKNKIKVATDENKPIIPKIIAPISTYERTKINLLFSSDFEISEIKRSSDATYVYVLGREYIDVDDQAFLDIYLVENMNKIVSKISTKIKGLRDYTALQTIDDMSLDGVDEVKEIPFGEGDCCYMDTTILFFRKKDKLISGLEMRSIHDEEGGYENKKRFPTPEKIKNQVWVENTVGYIEHKEGDEVDGDVKHNYFTNIEKYKFQNDSLILINPKKEDNYYFVRAKSGLNARYRPYLSSRSAEVLAYGTRVKVLNKTDFTYEIWDGFEPIKGNWVQIETENTNGTTDTSYVFDGYLTKELVDENAETEAGDKLANGKWVWSYDNGQVGEIGFYKDGKKEGKWKWFFKDGALKATGSYKNGKPVGARKWYYSYYGRDNDSLYCTGQYTDGKKEGEWKWYYTNGSLRNSIRFDKDTVVEYDVIDNKGKTILNKQGSSATIVNFDESYDYRDVFLLTITELNGYHINLDGRYMFIEKQKDSKASGVYKRYFNGALIEIGYFKEGKKTGVWKKYRSNGKLQSDETYKRGKRNGKSKSYYENGRLESISNYKKGLLKGIYKTYYESGKIKSIAKYKKGKKNGVRKYYRENGRLERVFNYKKGLKNGVCKTYYENGNVKSVTKYKKDKENGERKDYYENGNLKEITPYKNGIIHGEWTKYYENGRLEEKTQIKNGDFTKLHQTFYYKNGVVGATGYSDNGVKKYGEWRYYYPSGKLQVLTLYIDDKEEWKSYYENGQLKGQGRRIKGDRDGKFIYYKEDGTIKSATEYKYNSPYVWGEWKYYDNGQLKSVELYQRKEPVNWEYYYPNGQIKERRFYNSKEKDDGSISYRREVGIWEYYYPSGQIRLLETHTDDCRSGKSKYFHENGNLYKIEQWRCYDRLSETISCFDEKGNELEKGSLKDGNGTVYEYNAKGELLNIVNYKDGRRIKANESIDEVWLNSDKLNTLAWYAYEGETDKKKLNFAIKWVQRSIELDENYYNTDTYAALLYKTEKYKQALEIAEKAIEIAKKTDVEYNATTDLIKKIKAKIK